MKFVYCLLLFSLLNSLDAVSQEVVPATVPKWLNCKLKDQNYATYKTLFVSLPNRQVWGIYDNNATEAIAVMGLGITTHSITYSATNRAGSTTLPNHSLNGSSGGDFYRYSLNMTFNELEVSQVSILNGMIYDTPDVDYYSCSVSKKPAIVSQYEDKYMKKGYLQKALQG